MVQAAARSPDHVAAGGPYGSDSRNSNLSVRDPRRQFVHRDSGGAFDRNARHAGRMSASSALYVYRPIQPATDDDGLIRDAFRHRGRPCPVAVIVSYTVLLSLASDRRG
jgi:hypothetical protein